MQRLARALATMVLAIAMVGPQPSLAQHAHGSGPSIGLELVAGGLTAPIALTAPADGSGRRFVVDQIGQIRIITREGRLLDAPFLDLRDRIVELEQQYDERGLLGLAFHPDYARNGRFFVHYSGRLLAGAPAGYDHATRISEFRVSPENPARADRASERLVLEVPQPQSNHNGAQLAFGPDGYLYITLGDGGGADDWGRRDTLKIGHVPDWYERNPGGNGQDVEQNLLGSILRIDVNGTQPGKAYAIPADNPFVGRPGMDEIWAYGFRNPAHLSFDAQTGALFASDAGQELWEEINIVEKGGNYGWNVREGTHCFDARHPEHPPLDCPETAPGGTPLRDPILEYDHYSGVVVIGGSVYRGAQIPDFTGRYLFADWSRDHDHPEGTLFIATPPPAPEAMWKYQELRVEGRANGRIGEFVRAFGEDADRELYVLSSDRQGPAGSTGKVFRIISGSMGGGGGHAH